MSFVEMLPRVRALSRIEKLRMIHLLAEDLAQAEASEEIDINPQPPSSRRRVLAPTPGLCRWSRQCNHQVKRQSPRP
jgi:hypothetical protein